MNKERLAEIAEWLEGGAKHKHDGVIFDMAKGLAKNSCNTACCLAGAAVQFFDPDYAAALLAARTDTVYDGLSVPYEEADWENVTSGAIEVLDLDRETAHKLFRPDRNKPRSMLYDFNDPAWAARTIRHLIATGEVDWEATEVR